MTTVIGPCRSWLFAPGDNAKLLTRVPEAGADAIVLDLEDAVSVDRKAVARSLVSAWLRDNVGWVRINRPMTDEARRDLDQVTADAAGLRIPKVESAEEVEWVSRLSPGLPLVATIETAVGVAAAADIASHPAVVALALGAADLASDLRLGGDDLELLYVRSRLVIVCRVAGIRPPIDSVHRDVTDLRGLGASAQRAMSMGFFGKSAIHPRQVPVINAAFTPAVHDVERAREIVSAFAASHGEATTVEGVFVDAPVVARARDIIRLADMLP